MKKSKKQLEISVREEIVTFWMQHGWQATVTAYPISKSTLYNWIKSWKKEGVEGLKPRSRRPKKLGRKKVRPAIWVAIKEYDEGKQFKATASAVQRHLKMLKKYPRLSLSTIARVLKQIRQKYANQPSLDTN